ncbi:MAG: pseudouridine synthase [Candidatus Adiutrix sp.]
MGTTKAKSPKSPNARVPDRATGGTRRPSIRRPAGFAPKRLGARGGPNKRPSSINVGSGVLAENGENTLRVLKIISEAGLSSRRGAERLIQEGRVTVNREVITEPGTKANPFRDKIAVDGKLLGPPQKLSYFMFHKPSGFLTTLADPQERPTIKPYLDTLPVRVFPVGRLDMDVEGLLVLTNDGDLAKKLMHPSSQVPKIYRIKVAGLPDEESLEKLRDGSLVIEGRKAAPAEAVLIKSAEDRSWVLLTITEGRHHQVKRMCQAIGHPVLKLKRVAYGNLDLGRLRREEIRPLTRDEIYALKQATR